MNLKHSIKKILPKRWLNFLRSLIVPEKMVLMERDLKSFLLWHYRTLAAADINQKDDLRNHEFSIYSKVGEDGLILYIFSRIGAVNRRFVEFGVEDGRECNTANLSLNFGWQGMLVDARQELIEQAKSYYRDKLGKNSFKVKPVNCFITAENINQLLIDNGFQGEVDLFSMDIDGNDYWIWKSMTAIRPRLVVAEYNASLGLRPITIKYNPDFYHFKIYKDNPLYFGASLPALAKLAREKGYILIGCDSNGHDAFFLRKDLAEGKFAELPPDEAFYHLPHLLKTIGGVEKQFELIKHLDFENI